MYVIITSKQDIDTPESVQCESKVVLRTKILWEFNDYTAAMSAAKSFIRAGFEFVHLEMS